jgi:hypothetical protein
MSNFAGPVLSYLALLGLILTTGIATFETLKESLTRQFVQTTQAISGSGVTAERSGSSSPGDLYTHIFGEEKPGIELAEFSEERRDASPEGSGEQGALENHFSSMERLGAGISAKLSGRTP